MENMWKNNILILIFIFITITIGCKELEKVENIEIIKIAKAIPENTQQIKQNCNYLLLDEFGKGVYSIYPKEILKDSEFKVEKIIFNQKLFLKQIENVLIYFQKFKTEDPLAVNEGIFTSIGVTLKDIESTLNFIKDIIKEDNAKGRISRLTDSKFINKNFRIIRWLGYSKDKEKNSNIRITKYAVFTVKGSLKKTTIYRYALYELPDDEKGLSITEAEKQKNKLSRFRYTKQDIIKGVYDKGGAKPLIWLTRDALEEALMQGTVCVELDNGQKKFFNVDRNNGIKYDSKVAPMLQNRYWYFREVDAPKGYGKDSESKITVYPEVVFAGDVYNIGLGKIIGIRYLNSASHKNEIRLGILADTGGAFRPNLGQLDYFAGIFNSRNEFYTHIQELPSWAEGYILIKK